MPQQTVAALRQSSRSPRREQLPPEISKSNVSLWTKVLKKSFFADLLLI